LGARSSSTTRSRAATSSLAEDATTRPRSAVSVGVGVGVGVGASFVDLGFLAAAAAAVAFPRARARCAFAEHRFSRATTRPTRKLWGALDAHDAATPLMTRARIAQSPLNDDAEHDAHVRSAFLSIKPARPRGGTRAEI
jgi:hypothetical protein